MAVESVPAVPEGVSFEQAIALTQALLDHTEQGHPAEAELGKTVADLVSSENGARGFFVTYLSDDRPLADAPTPAILAALQQSPSVVSPLLVKNLAMSTAMAIAHRRNQNEDLAQGSDRVRARTLGLIQALQLPQVQQEAKQLAHSIQTATGDYQAFLQRWQYDAEQKQAIYAALKQAGIV
jgi:signal transduction histidine kinase